jgi:outer membrane protein assembly factor BamB
MKGRAGFVVVLLVCVLIASPWLASTARAGDAWPQFRGPNGDGVSDAKRLATQWAEDKNVAWKTAIHGRAWSSPVILGEQIWLTTATEDGRELYAVCVNRDTGKVAHDVKVFDVEKPQFTHRFNSYGSPTPVIEPGRVYVTFGAHGTACLDTATGKTIWERRDFVCNHFRGPGSSLFLYDNLLMLNFDGSDFQYIAAMDKHTGKTVWKTDRSIAFDDLDPDGKPMAHGDKRKAFSTPRVSMHSGKPQIISVGSNAMYAYDPADGKEQWRVEIREAHSDTATPLIGERFIYFCTGLGRKELVAVKPGGSGVLDSTHIAWRTNKNIPSRGSPTLANGRIFMVDDGGVASCLDAETGKEIWKSRLEGNYSASPILGAGHVYFFNEDGLATVVDATGDRFEQVAQNQLDEGFMASPAVAGEALFLRTRTHLYRIESKAPAQAAAAR